MIAGDITRRSLVRGAAWSVPVIAAAIATPLAAASEPIVQVKDRLTFNTARTWDENPGGYRPRVGVVVAAMDKTGPDAVGPVVIVVTIVDAAGRQQSQSTTKVIASAWGATPDWTVYFEGVARGQYTVRLTATGAAAKTITQQLQKRTVLS
jgi:hypothetical protein